MPAPQAPHGPNSTTDASSGIRAARATGRVLGQGLGKAGRWTARAAGRFGRGSARWARRHQGPLNGVAERLLWWGALACITVAGIDLLGGFASDEAYARIPWLSLAAFGMCACVCFWTAAPHLRKGAFALGSASAAVGLVAWMSGVA